MRRDEAEMRGEMGRGYGATLTVGAFWAGGCECALGTICGLRVKR